MSDLMIELTQELYEIFKEDNPQKFDRMCENYGDWNDVWDEMEDWIMFDVKDALDYLQMVADNNLALHQRANDLIERLNVWKHETDEFLN